MAGLAGLDRKETLREWGDWLSTEWHWCAFVTLTHDNSENALGRGTRNIVGWKASADRWDSWLTETVEPMSRPAAGLASVWWVRGREPNPWRKGTHFHALVGGICGECSGADVSRRAMWAGWFDKGYGLARILPYEPSRGAAHYLTKYVVKELGDVVFSPNLGLHRRVK